MSTAPYKDSDLAQFIAKRVLELRPKTQADIASEAGFVNGNFLSMLKAGNSKLALDRVPALLRFVRQSLHLRAFRSTFDARNSLRV